MKTHFFIAGAAFLLALCGHTAEPKPPGSVEASTTDDLKERAAIDAAVRRAVMLNDFRGLNAMEMEFRTRRSRTPAGGWKLSWFYESLGSDFATRQGEGCVSDLVPFAQQWENVDPKQPGPYIAQAIGLLASAWCMRGDGPASTVTPQGGAGFRQYAAAANEVLEAHRDVASVDPEFYAQLLVSYTAQGSSGWSFERLLKEAVDHEPYYWGTYHAAIQYYAPRWYGDGNDIEWLARFAAKHTSEGEGMGMYARIFWGAESYDVESQADWPTMVQGMRDVMRVYPNDLNAANFARLSCRTGHPETTHEFLALVSDLASWRSVIDGDGGAGCSNS